MIGCDSTPLHADARPSWTDRPIAELVDELNEKGFVSLPSVFTSEQIDSARSQGLRAVEANGGETTTFDASAALDGYLLSGLANDADLKEFCRTLFLRMVGREPPSDEFMQVYRYLSGESMARHSDYFHFDSYCVTILIPIDLPEAGPGRELILLPNLRASNQGYFLNVACKFVLDRKMIQRLLRRAIDRRIRPTRMALELGNLYIFNGFRTIHTNVRSLPGTRRATLLLHFGNPHHDARSRHLLHAAASTMSRFVRSIRGVGRLSVRA